MAPQPSISGGDFRLFSKLFWRRLRLIAKPLDGGASDLKRDGYECFARYNPRMNWQERISVNPGVRSGKPCVKGTRITVYDVLEYLAGGMSEDQILADFPDLTRDDIRACLGFAAARERRLVNSLA
jgi:uncharacterized protein (DUF433 family)